MSTLLVLGGSGRTGLHVLAQAATRPRMPIAAITETALRKAEQETQKLTEQFGQKIDDVIKKKEQEIMEV